MAINNTLKDIREERNLIQADLAEAIVVHLHEEGTVQ